MWWWTGRACRRRCGRSPLVRRGTCNALLHPHQGNRLTLEEAEAVIVGPAQGFSRAGPGRRGGTKLLGGVDACPGVGPAKSRPVSEDLIKRLAGLVVRGKRPGRRPIETDRT